MQYKIFALNCNPEPSQQGWFENKNNYWQEDNWRQYFTIIIIIIIILSVCVTQLQLYFISSNDSLVAQSNSQCC